MEPVERVSGTALPLGYSDVDTDQIVPSDALKRIERTGFGQFLFSSWREDEDFIMHRDEHKDAVILIAGENFGSGSSREHAVWAIQDHGFDAVIAPSFADIFKNNSTKNGLLAIDLPEETVKDLLEAVREDPETVITIETRRAHRHSPQRARDLRDGRLHPPAHHAGPRRHKPHPHARGRPRSLRKFPASPSTKRAVAVPFDERR